MLGVPTDDALPYNYGEVFSKEGIHAGVLREVECRPSMAILPVYKHSFSTSLSASLAQV